MSHIIRMQLIAKVTYYVGWIALLCGGLIQLHIATRPFIALSISKRNVFEIAVVCFLICIASELRAHVSPGTEFLVAAKKVA